jgi:hypothetical protein
MAIDNHFPQSAMGHHACYRPKAAEAVAHLTDSAGAMGGFVGIQTEIRRQAECLVEWAKKRGVFLTDSYYASTTSPGAGCTTRAPGRRARSCSSNH